MDYAGMAQKLGQFRQAQVPGGGQRLMTQPMGSALMPGSQQGFQPQQQQPQQSQWWGSVMGGGLADKFKGGRGGFNAAGRWSRNRPLGS
jgi:hypothetical protein